jgi:hypothetical protein
MPVLSLLSRFGSMVRSLRKRIGTGKFTSTSKDFGLAQNRQCTQLTHVIPGKSLLVTSSDFRYAHFQERISDA